MKNLISQIVYGNRLTAFLRFITGSLFIFSGISKTINPVLFAEAISRYGIIPQMLIPYIAIVLPLVEGICGILLVFGFRTKAASLLTFGMLCVFTVGISWNYAMGRSFNCGCFSMGSTNVFSMIGLPIILRNIALSCVCILVFFARKHSLSIDYYLEKKALRGY